MTELDQFKHAIYACLLAELGVTLNRLLSEYHWEFESSAGVWLTKKPNEVTQLDKMFEYKDDWKAFLGTKDLIIFAGHDDWFGFTLD